MEKQTKKRHFRHFLKNVDKKNAFFRRARPPHKLVFIGAKGAFIKILGYLTKNRYLKLVQTGPFGSAGGRNPLLTVMNIEQEKPDAKQVLQKTDKINFRTDFFVIDRINYCDVIIMSQINPASIPNTY